MVALFYSAKPILHAYWFAAVFLHWQLALNSLDAYEVVHSHNEVFLPYMLRVLLVFATAAAEIVCRGCLVHVS